MYPKIPWHAPLCLTRTSCRYVRNGKRESWTYLFESYASIRNKSAEGALLVFFQTGFVSFKGGMKNSSYVFVEHLLTEMYYEGALDNLFDPSIEHRTPALVFMEVLARRALTSSSVFWPVAKSILENLKEQAEVIDQASVPLDSSFTPYTERVHLQ